MIPVQMCQRQVMQIEKNGYFYRTISLGALLLHVHTSDYNSIAIRVLTLFEEVVIFLRIQRLRSTFEGALHHALSRERSANRGDQNWQLFRKTVARGTPCIFERERLIALSRDRRDFSFQRCPDDLFGKNVSRCATADRFYFPTTHRNHYLVFLPFCHPCILPHNRTFLFWYKRTLSF